ncbi:MAG: hypothetical protein ACSHX6_01130 [Akkermansiaceae bacterium]
MSCEETLETPLPLLIKLEDPEPIKHPKFSVKLQGNFEEILNQLCAIHGMEMKVKDQSYIISTQASIEDEAPVTINLQVAPDLINEEAQSTKITSIKNLNLLVDDKKLQLFYKRQTATLIIQGPAHSAERVKRIVENVNSISPVQIKILSKIISYSPLTMTPEIKNILAKGILTEGEKQILLRFTAQLKGTETASLPSIVTRPNEQATIEIIRETLKPKSFLGHKLQFQASIKGLSIEIDHQLNYHQTANMNFCKPGDSKAPLDKDAPIKILKHKANFNLTARDDLTHVLKVNIPNSNKEHYLLIKSTVIDATGKRLNLAN